MPSSTMGDGITFPVRPLHCQIISPVFKSYVRTIFVGAGEGSKLWEFEMTRRAAESADADK